MPLQSFPPELLLEIGTFLGPTSSLSSLIRSCRSLHASLNPLLYRLLLRSDGGQSALFWAARTDNALVASHLLSNHGVDVMVRGECAMAAAVAAAGGTAANVSAFRPTALHLAAKHSALGAARVLLQHGADANDDGGGFVRPYHGAKVPLLALLLDHGAAIDANVRACELTPLCCAAHHRYDAGVLFLLERGADPNAVVWVPHLARAVQTSPLFYAAVPWRSEAVERLLEKGACVDRAVEMARESAWWIGDAEVEAVVERLVETGRRVSDRRAEEEAAGARTEDEDEEDEEEVVDKAPEASKPYGGVHEIQQE